MGCINYTVRNPVGVAALISPWNLPLYLLTFKIAPAIASGNNYIPIISHFHILNEKIFFREYCGLQAQ